MCLFWDCVKTVSQLPLQIRKVIPHTRRILLGELFNWCILYMYLCLFSVDFCRSV